MRVTLVTSPHVRHPAVLASDFEIAATSMYGFAPIGLLSLMSTAARDTTASAELFDLNRAITSGALSLGADFYEQAASAIVGRGPDVVGFMTECDSYHHVLQICEVVKRLAPECAVVLGGPHASAVAQPTMERRRCIDAVAVGEAETSFPALIRALIDGSDRPVAGVLRRLRDGTYVDGGPTTLIEHLDDLPVPDYAAYSPQLGEEIFLEVGRGCPFGCRFCSTAPFWKRRHRVKSPSRILSEVRLIRDLYGPSRLHFTHDLFTTNREWVEQLCSALLDAKVPARWTCSARVDTVDRRLLTLMAAAGCDAIYFGVESGSQRILESIHKAIPIRESMRVLRECLEAGITPNAGFICGFPGEDEDSLQDTFNAYDEALAIGARPTHIFGFCPFADSSMYASLEGLTCRGHFIDLPLGAALDQANRALIASDSKLFGSYFRPMLPALQGREPWIDAVDEFSLLVESAIHPARLLAQSLGGMFMLFRRWVDWIGARNSKRLTPSFRRYYGRPVDFAEFLEDTLKSTPQAPSFAVSLARIARTTLALQAQSANLPAISMATHRSYHSSQLVRPLQSSDPLSLGNVAACLEVPEDLRAWLAARPGDEPPTPASGPLFLVWQEVSPGGYRLLDVSRAMYQMILLVADGPKMGSHLLAAASRFPSIASTEQSGTPLDSEFLMQAINSGLLRVQPCED